MSQVEEATNPQPASGERLDRGGIAGHPRGLTTLFFTEMWERFSYYGMRALLILFMTAPLTGVNPGLGFDPAKAAPIYGLYTSIVYLLALPGGWVADKLWGQRRAVFVGGCIIACGHFSMAVPMVPTFYLGLILIALGTGLLKPNVSTMVADLYPEGGARRDAGFSIFYMGINLGAVLGTSLCGFIGEVHNFHWGFSLAGVGMVLGLIQYKLGAKRLGEAGLLRSADEPHALQHRARNFYLTAAGIAAVVTILAFLRDFRRDPSYHSAIGDVAGVRHLDSQRAVFPIPVHCGRSVEDGEEAPRRDRLALSPLGCVLVRLRASRLLHEYLCARPYRPCRLGLGDARQLATECQSRSHRPVRTGVWVALDLAGAPQRQPLDPSQIRSRPLRAGCRILCDLLGCSERRGGEPGVHVLVSGHLFPSHGG